MMAQFSHRDLLYGECFPLQNPNRNCEIWILRLVWAKETYNAYMICGSLVSCEFNFFLLERILNDEETCFDVGLVPRIFSAARTFTVVFRKNVRIHQFASKSRWLESLILVERLAMGTLNSWSSKTGFRFNLKNLIICTDCLDWNLKMFPSIIPAVERKKLSPVFEIRI